MPAENTPDINDALNSLREDGDQTSFLYALATGEVLVPQMEPTGETEGVRLPFIEQEGTRYVLAFSTQERLTQSGVEAEHSVPLRGAELGASWPQGEDLWLAIDPGTEQGVTVPPDAVRALPSLAA